jgi:hypothetical protein
VGATALVDEAMTMTHRYAFSPKGVLRHLKPSLIKDYCAANQLFSGADFLDGDEIDLDLLCQAIQGLTAALRTDVEQDLQDVYQLADEEGQRMIYEEARSRGEDLTAVLTELDSTYDSAMWTLLNREALFNELIRFRSADSLSRRSWHSRRGIGTVDVDTTQRAIDRLSLTLSDYLVQKEGRGHRCHIDYLRRSTGHLFIAYPEDFPTTLFEYDDADELACRRIRPTSDLLFFYSPEAGKLEIFAQGGKKKVQDLQVIFAKAILGIGLGPAGRDGRIYDLNLLKRRDFGFMIDPTTGLLEIEVKTIHLRDRDGGRGLTLEVGGPPGQGIIFAAERYFAIEPAQTTGKYPLYLMDIDRVYLQAHFRPLGRKIRGRTRTFGLSTSTCPLDQEGVDGIVRKALVDSGLEKSAPDLVAA